MTDHAALLGLDPAGGYGAPDPGLLAAVRGTWQDDPAREPVLPAGTTVRALLPVLIALVPESLDRFASFGIGADVAAESLSDVGRKVRVYGAGADTPWLAGLLRADVVALGRLQVGRVPEAGGHALHVPELGPLDPAAVDRSLARAAAWCGTDAFTCHSWLLDDLLPRVLDPGSNILRFASRFTVVDGGTRPAPGGPATTADHMVARFVFRRPLDEVLDAGAPAPAPDGVLRRFVAEHLRAGGHWTEPLGALTLPGAAGHRRA